MEIEGVTVRKIDKICDDRGRIMHMMKSKDKEFKKFGEIYFSTCYPGIVKGWHIHTKMTLNYVCVKGMIKLVMSDIRPDSKTIGNIKEVCIGDHNYALVSIPPGIWNGFMCISNEEAIVANLTDIPHDPDEIKRADPVTGTMATPDGVNMVVAYKWDVEWR